MFIKMQWQEIVLRASEYLLTRCEWFLRREENRLNDRAAVKIYLIAAVISMVFTKLLLENALAIRPCNCEAASEPLLPKVARCIPVLPSRYIGKCAAHVLKRSGITEIHLAILELWSSKGGFPVMAETTRKLAASTRWQFFFFASTTASTRCLVQNFQLICYSQRVNAMSQYNNVVVRDVQNGRTRCDGCSGETLLDPCTRKKRLQRKMTEYYHWIGVQENIGIFSKS